MWLVGPSGARRFDPQEEMPRIATLRHSLPCPATVGLAGTAVRPKRAYKLGALSVLLSRGG